MTYDENLAERIRAILADEPGVSERKMFGGLTFMLNGNMVGGPTKDTLVVRVGPDAYQDALAEPEARPLTFTKFPMRGFVEIDAAELADDELLAAWITRGVDFAKSLPAK
jgi:TfoX/Sxy family transcriptional regulator of competence genes